MLCIKKLYREELLQLALLLSLLRVDPDSYLGLDIQSIGVGSLNLHNGSGWHTDARTVVHRPMFVHPKNLDSMLINYERDLFEELNSLGRYNRLGAPNDIHAYLLNVEDPGRDPGEAAGPSAEGNGRNASEPDPHSEAQGNRQDASAELTQEDMDLIEVLWKQDVDLGLPLVDPDQTSQSPSTSEKNSPDEIEKLKTLEAINATKIEDNKETEEPKEDDPWAGLSYTIDLETGEYIPTGSPSGCGNSTGESADQFLGAPSLNLDDSPIGLTDDSLGLNDSLGLEDDFASELLSDSLLGGDGVEGLLSNDSLGLPDGFNLEEALQLVGLNEVQPEEIKQEEKKKKLDCAKSNSPDLPGGSESGNDLNSSSSDDPEDDMIHTPQFHHPHHSHRSLQGRVPPFMRTMSMDQRWPDLSTFLTTPDHFTHPAHPYPGHGISHHSHYDAQRNVLLHNATLAPPVGDLNSTGPYHHVGGPSNFGSAVATSMNLTNSSEPMGPENTGAYKSEPSDMMYYQTPTTDSMNQSSETLFSSLLTEEDFALMDMGVNESMYSMRMLDNSSNNASGPTGAAALPGVQGAGNNGGSGGGVTSLGGVTDERMDASSDSAVSSMGSERGPLSDGEWMETGSNSSHTQPDSHYSMDYASKYRMPYDCNYSIGGRNGGSPRCQADRVPPVAQKKHQMFGKRCFQEQGTGSLLGASPHPTTPIKYEYDGHTVGAGPPGNAYSGPIEGAAGPQPELKYSCSVDFSRHQAVPQIPGRTALEHVHHNHTYHLPGDNSGPMQRPLSRDKKARKHDADEHLTRDEKKARSLNVPITVQDIINLPMDEFNERLSKYDLSEQQLTLIRDIRRRGKNKVAAQNCRKRKLDQIISLADQVKEMRDRKLRLIREREFMLMETQRVKAKYHQLYAHVFQSMRDPDGNQYSRNEYSFQQSAEGNVLLVPKNQTNSHHSRSSTMEPKTKPDPDHKE
ncbi:segmentation protein cap'n'collar isoform X2 [Diachasma alloeum]|uniref:segmentation protein cap'n'collar isoform X2 n=1 Tax=Diachasma alloeum TaxID=454923 RepID=UPI0007382994|nr:segmentation protein cap'n'collar isoform X2 [Diachasma alloeum]